ncbi:glutaminyl-peptide cyclotransferase [Pseudoflavitalea sp. G-6-1-2]|uniref:glutaminyl-peptide cyclotransferase n=1 Tax=Pseudoflavitalea sp. G-6-1-2 TaxID=2728841 RepID=UPI00146DBD73|nr:glutaminyl-peptide cyclotransferase [Pseudoflavitalea sp. G-6-1-2]NML23350.1 glutaminyl-peptide cyclotransferase [Pseudoflavitalea sp. G-6-1-2]
MKNLIPDMLALLIAMAGCSNPEHATSATKSDSSIPASINIGYTVFASYPHDTTYFTEGLEYFDDKLWESSGGNLAESPFPSVLGVVNTKKGINDPEILLDRRKYFAEGITFFNNKLYWLTLDNGVGFVYDLQSKQKLKEFKLPSIERKGWGLTHDSTHLIMSDGTNRLYYLHPDSLIRYKVLEVRDENGPVTNLNELEYVNGTIFANQWLTNNILLINAGTGYVKGKIDLSPLQQKADKQLIVYRELNGIAYNPKTGRYMITGKKWPEMYEITLHQ